MTTVGKAPRMGQAIILVLRAGKGFISKSFPSRLVTGKSLISGVIVVDEFTLAG